MPQKRFGYEVMAVLTFTLILATSLLAQLSTGKIEGTVRDTDTGSPLAGAQVVVEGTRLGNVTNADGYYFILNVPPGRRDVTFSYTGYQKITMSNLLIFADQTITVDGGLSSTVVQLEGITVGSGSVPLVLRDQTVSKARLTPEHMAETPNTVLEDLLIMEAGVQTGGADALGRGLRIRGGSVGQEGMIVDGVMVRNFTAQPGGGGSAEAGQHGQDTTPLEFSVASVEEVTVITGGFQAEYGNILSGIVNIVTKGGGPQFRGNVRYTTDEVNPRTADYGYNQLRASLGGPTGVSNLYFQVSGELQGNADRTPTHADEGFRGVNQDFVDRLNNAVANDPVLGQEESPFTLEGFRTAREFYATQTGESTALFSPGNPVRLPDNWGDRALMSTKLTYSPVSGLKVLGTTNLSRNQYTYPPGGGNGNYFQDGIFTAGDPNWTNSPYFKSGQTEIFIPQGRARRTKTNNLLLGVDWDFLRTAKRSASLQFRYTRLRTNEVNNGMLQVNHSRDTFMGVNVHDIRFEVEQYPGRQTMTELDERRQYVPDGESLFKPNINYETPFAVSTYNPYTVEYRYLREWQNNYKLDLDMQLNRYNRAKIGIQYTDFENLAFRVRAFSARRSEKGYDYRPKLIGAYMQNRTDLGDFVFDYGLRFDAFHPVDNWGISNADLVGQHTTPKNMSTWSPRFDVAFPVTDKSQLRFSYGVFTQVPNLNTIYSYAEFGGSNQNPGDLEFIKTDAYEAGLSYLLSEQMVLDFSAYYRDLEGQPRTTTFFREYTPYVDNYLIRQWRSGLANRGMGNVKGIDAKISKRYANNFAFNLIYTLQFSRYTAAGGQSYDPVSNLAVGPADELFPSGGDRTHQLTLQVNYGFSEDFQAGTLAGKVLNNLKAYSVYRLLSGESSGGLSRGRWYHDLSLRITKDFAIGRGRRVSVFAELFNALNRKESVLYPRNYRLDDPAYAAITGGTDLVWSSLSEADNNRVRFNADFNGDGVLTSREAAMGQMAYQNMMATMNKRAWGLARQIRSGISLSF